MISSKDQDYQVKTTDATYSQHDDLTEEITLSANIGYEKNISDQHYLKFNSVSTRNGLSVSFFLEINCFLIFLGEYLKYKSLSFANVL